MLNRHKLSSRKNRKPSVLFVLAIALQLTILAVLGTATQAFAQLPGKSNSRNQEQVVGGQLQTQGIFSEARNGGHLLEVWREWNNDQVWMARDNGLPFTIGWTETKVSPAVVPWGPDAFLVFHTGVDGNIWFSGVNGDGTNWSTWRNLPGNTTNMPVSLAQMGPNSFKVYMVYRGVGNDPRVWGTWWKPDGSWSTPENISGGLASSAPAVVLNNVSNNLFVTAQGLDNQLWMTNQPLGAIGWNSWPPLGVDTFDTAHLAANSSGAMVVRILNGNSQPQHALFNLFGNQQTQWFTDSPERG